MGRSAGHRVLLATLLAPGSVVCLAQETAVFWDPVGDDRALRQDGGPLSGLPVAHRLPDIVRCELGAWQPEDPVQDLFWGAPSPVGDFFRLDVVFRGLVNPPGPMFGDTFLYGDNPVLGFLEIDMDANADTGGEVVQAGLRYLGNVTRFGGLPAPPRIATRAALDVCPGNFDQNILTGPYFPERSGEEFHLALLHSEVLTVDVGSNGDTVFEVGESWRFSGTFLHRAHGYEPFSLACCSGAPGSYIPVTQLLFEHSPVTDQTTVSLVYPLNPLGAAAMAGGPVEPPDGDAANQNSVLEALDDLVFSAIFATVEDRNHPNFGLIEPWEQAAADAFADPLQWNINVLVVGALVDTNGVTPILAWTDVFPNARPGDFNGDRFLDPVDVALFNGFLAASDGGSCDGDGILNGEFRVIGFGSNFNMFDVNYDGLVNAADRPVPTSFDADLDGDVDLADFALFQRCFAPPDGTGGMPSCGLLDIDGDGQMTTEDLLGFLAALSGPL